jgi:hypothetical protein
MRRALPALLCAVTLLLAACGSDEQVVHPYDRTPVPAVPDRTAEVVDSDPLPNGQYWAPTVTADGGRLTFDLAQAFFGPACAEALGADQCDGDMGLKADPTRSFTVDPTGAAPISVVAENRQNYAIPAPELVNLVGGGDPSADAPDGYGYTEFPYLLTVDAGTVTAIQQIWMP